MLYYEFGSYTFEIIAKSPRGQYVKTKTISTEKY